MAACLTEQSGVKDKKKAGKKGQKAGPEFLPERVRALLGDKQAAIERFLGGVGDMYDDAGHPTKDIAPKSYTPPSHSEIAKDHHADAPAVQTGAHPEKPEGGDAHAHASDWLNEMAEELAAAASKNIGGKVKDAWDEQAKGRSAAVRSPRSTARSIATSTTRRDARRRGRPPRRSSSTTRRSPLVCATSWSTRAASP